MAGAVIGGVLSRRIHRLRGHQSSPQAELAASHQGLQRQAHSRAVMPESLAGTLVTYLEGKQPEWNLPDEKVREKRCPH